MEVVVVASTDGEVAEQTETQEYAHCLVLRVLLLVLQVIYDRSDEVYTDKH